MYNKKNFFFTIIYLIIIFIVFELFLRLAFPNFLKTSNQNVLEEHKEYGWTFIKNLNLNYFNKYSKKSTDLITNSQGFRVLNYQVYKENIIFLGDSVSAGLGVNGDKIFPSLVSNKLNYNGHNFSVNGYSTDQSFIILDKVYDFLKPKIVVYTLVHNDLEYNLKNFINTKQYKLGKPSLNKNFEIIQKPFFLEPQLNKSKKFKVFMNNNFATYRLLAFTKELTSLYKKQKNINFFSELNFDYNLDEEAKNQIKFLINILNQIKNICEENNSIFVVVKAFSIDDLKFLSVNNKNSGKFYKYKKYNNYLDEQIKKNQINYINFNKIINKVDLNKNIPFFNFKKIIYDGHYNELGHKTMADIILSEINNF